MFCGRLLAAARIVVAQRGLVGATLALGFLMRVWSLVRVRVLDPAMPVACAAEWLVASDCLLGHRVEASRAEGFSPPV
jgi:hypothetical protein